MVKKVSERGVKVKLELLSRVCCTQKKHQKNLLVCVALFLNHFVRYSPHSLSGTFCA